MKEQHKIDQFFSEKMRNDENVGDWAIPSDDIWIAAQKRFPKVKKKRRLFIWFFFGSVLIGLFAYSSSLALSNNEALKDKNQVENNLVETTTSSKAKNFNDQEYASLSSNSPSQISSNSESTTSKATLLIKEKKIINEQPIANKTKSLNEKVNPSNNEYLTKEKSRNERSKVSQTQEQLKISDGAYPAKSTIATNKPLANKLATISTSKSLKLEVPAIQHIAQNAYSLERTKKPIGSEFILINKHNSFLNRGFGISHLYLPITLLESAISLEDPEDFLAIDLSYYNVNFNYERYFNPKWSWSSSVNLSMINLKLDLSVMDTLNSDIYSFVSNELDQVAPRNITDDKIELLDDVVVNEGDLIRVNATIDAGVQAIQIPIFLHRHWYKGKFNFALGAGIGLDLVKYSVNEFNLEVYNETGIINKPILINQETELEIDYSIYANASTQYKITNKLNLGLALRASIREPLLSGFDLGIYYRWHK